MYIDIWQGILGELVHVIMVSEKSKVRSTSGWRHYNVGSVAQSKWLSQVAECQGLRTREANGMTHLKQKVWLWRRVGMPWGNSWSSKASESRDLMSKAAEENSDPLSERDQLAFYSSLIPANWTVLSHTEARSSPPSPLTLTCQYPLETPLQTHPN